MVPTYALHAGPQSISHATVDIAVGVALGVTAVAAFYLVLRKYVTSEGRSEPP